MNCITCEVEIDPKWKHALAQNLCPYCGNSIMDEQLQNLLSSLQQTMDALQDYPEQLNDWLLSNYGFIKTDSPDIGIYMPKDMLEEFKKAAEEGRNFLERQGKSKKEVIKIQTETGEEEVITEKIQSEEKTSEFFKRAEAVKPRLDGFRSAVEKTEHLKALKKQIERAGTTSIGTDTEIISPEMLENADPEAVAEFQSAISGGEIYAPESDYEEEIIGESVVNALSNMKNQGSSNADFQKLQRMHQRTAESRKNFRSGSKGSFSRG